MHIAAKRVVGAFKGFLGDKDKLPACHIYGMFFFPDSN
jgi:hypothetical protein